MKRPGFLAAALLFRRLAKSLDSATQQLERIADLQEKRLKMDAVIKNFPLEMIDELEPASREDYDGTPDVATQSDQDFAEMEALEKLYTAVHGKPPADDDDLEELRKNFTDDGKPR